MRSILIRNIFLGFSFFLFSLSLIFATLSKDAAMGTDVASGSSITSTTWNAIIANIRELDTRTAAVFSSGGNVGIGTPNPGVKLDVNGKIKALSFGLDITQVSNSIQQTWGKSVSVQCPVNYTVISGGCATVQYGGYLIENRPFNNGWLCVSYDTYGTAYPTTVYAMCVRTQ